MTDLVAMTGGIGADEMELMVLMGSSEFGPGLKIETAQSRSCAMAESHRQDAPLSGPRTFRNPRWSAVFAGDLLDQKEVPFREVLADLEADKLSTISSLNGIFAIAAYDSIDQKLYAISDQRSQKPLFYANDEQRFCVATSLSTFTRLQKTPQFEETWLWQVLYFNFPVDDATFLKGVRRLPPATLLSFDCRSGTVKTHRYAAQVRARLPLLKGREALEVAANIFRARTASHYGGADSAACALTGGWDGRTMLALAPPETRVTAYTYGVPGCTDLIGATSTAAIVGADHVRIPFDQGFVSDLPRDALETVYLSGGLQSILRSSLHYVYRTLTEGGTRFPLTISGISLGTQLRGAAQYPDLVSSDLASHFQGLGAAHGEDYWREIIGRKSNEFMQFVQGRLDFLKCQFGPLESPEHHLSYTVYPASAHYFCGELAISDRYTSVRVPAWDSDIIDLVYSIENSTLSYSHFAKRTTKVHRQEMILQAYLLKRFCQSLYRVPVRGIHPAAVLGGEVPYQLERAYRSLMRKFSNRILGHYDAPLEDWTMWLFDTHGQFVKDMLCPSGTCIHEYIEPTFVDAAVADRDVRVVGKLLTIEIILQLIRNRWQRFWP